MRRRSVTRRHCQETDSTDDMVVEYGYDCLQLRGDHHILTPRGRSQNQLCKQHDSRRRALPTTNIISVTCSSSVNLLTAATRIDIIPAESDTR